jgi:hypothetical protein
MFKKLAEGLADKFKINAPANEIKSFIVNFFDEVITLYECDEFFKMVHTETKKHYSEDDE